MTRQKELLLVTLLFLLAVVLRVWDLTRLPPGFNNEELAYIRLTEAAREGNISVYYHVGDGHGRAGMYAIGSDLVTEVVGDGLLGYRMLSGGSALLALALLYALARRLFGSPVALIALAVMSVNLRAVLLARTATAESLVPLYTTLTLLVLAIAFNLRREIRFRTPQTFPFALVAVLFGGSGYLHHTTLILGPLGAAFFAHLLITRQPLSRRVWSGAFFVLALATVVATPYLISTFRETEGSEPYVWWSERPANVRDAVDGLLRAAGGLWIEGDNRVTLNVPHQPILGPLLSVVMLLGLAEALRHWREPRYALILLALAGGLATDAWIEARPTFSSNLVALPAVYILTAVGFATLAQMLRARSAAYVWQPVLLLLGLSLVANVFAVRARLFHSWAKDAAVAEAYHADLGRLAAYLDRTPDGLPVSLCKVGLREPNEIGLSPRQILPLMLHRRDLNLRQSDCATGLVFINAGAPMRFVFVDPDERALMPPDLVDWLIDAEPVEAEGLPGGAVLRLDVEQRVRDAGGIWAALATETWYPPGVEGQNVVSALPISLEGHLTLAGYDPAALTPRTAGGDPVALVTYWRVDGKLPPGLGIFAQLLPYWEDPETGQHAPLAEPWAETNTLDVVPSLLRNRDFFVQVSYIWLSEATKPGEFALVTGAYAGTIYDHLDVVDSQTGELRGDRVWLGDINVNAAPGAADNGAE